MNILKYINSLIDEGGEMIDTPLYELLNEQEQVCYEYVSRDLKGYYFWPNHSIRNTVNVLRANALHFSETLERFKIWKSIATKMLDCFSKLTDDPQSPVKLTTDLKAEIAELIDTIDLKIENIEALAERREIENVRIVEKLWLDSELPSDIRVYAKDLLKAFYEHAYSNDSTPTQKVVKLGDRCVTLERVVDTYLNELAMHIYLVDMSSIVEQWQNPYEHDLYYGWLNLSDGDVLDEDRAQHIVDRLYGKEAA